MAELTPRRYEAMFLLPPAVGEHLKTVAQELRSILARGEAEIELLARWDERKLAYTIDGHKRGLYALAYFTAPPRGLASIERDCNLSENVLRSMVIKADHIGETELELARKEFADLDEAAALLAAGQTPGGETSESAEAGAEAEADEPAVGQTQPAGADADADESEAGAPEGDEPVTAGQSRESS